jgi:hypothetical protein
LDRATGATIETIPGAKKVWESVHESLLLLGRRKVYEIRGNNRSPAKIPAESFALLDAAFAPGIVLLAEAGGPIRSLSTESLKERWRHRVAGEHWLVRFDPETGEQTDLCEFGSGWESALCFDARYLVAADGAVISTASGKVEYTLPFGTSDRYETV